MYMGTFVLLVLNVILESFFLKMAVNIKIAGIGSKTDLNWRLCDTSKT